MSSSDQEHLPRAGRQPVTPCDELSVSLTVEPNDYSLQLVDAELRDMSRRGAKLHASTIVELTDHLTLRIISPKLRGPIDIDAKVCWTKPHEGGGCTLGVAFAPPLPPRVFESLFAPEESNRRREKRNCISIKTAGLWEMAQGEFEGEITDLCPNGFCLTSNCEGSPNSRLMLRFDYEGKSARVTARSQWQVQSNGLFVNGCQFVTPNGYSILRKVSTLGDDAREPSRLRRLFLGT